MIVKAKDLQVGDRIGQAIVTKKEFVLPYVRIWTTYQGLTSPPYDYQDTDEIAIHRGSVIQKRDGSFEPFSKEKLKRSIHKAVLDLPEEEWQFGYIQQVVDNISEWNPSNTNVIRLFIGNYTRWNWIKKYESYNKR